MKPIVGILLLLTMSGVTLAQHVSGVDPGLEDLREISVSILCNPAHLEAAQVSERSIRTQVELSLRREGLMISESADDRFTIAVDLLDVRSSFEGYVYSVRGILERRAVLCSELSQWAKAPDSVFGGVSRLNCGQDIKYWAAVWSDGTYGIAGSGKLIRDAIEKSVRMVLDQYTNDLLAARQAADQLERLIQKHLDSLGSGGVR